MPKLLVRSKRALIQSRNINSLVNSTCLRTKEIELISSFSIFELRANRPVIRLFIFIRDCLTNSICRQIDFFGLDIPYVRVIKITSEAPISDHKTGSPCKIASWMTVIRDACQFSFSGAITRSAQSKCDRSSVLVFWPTNKYFSGIVTFIYSLICKKLLLNSAFLLL